MESKANQSNNSSSADISELEIKNIHQDLQKTLIVKRVRKQEDLEECGGGGGGGGGADLEAGNGRVQPLDALIQPDADFTAYYLR